MSDMQAVVTLEGKDNASAAIKEVSRALEETKGSADKASESFERIKNGFESGLGFAAGITGFRELKDILEGLGDATVNFNGMLEETTMRLENLTGSAAGAAETIGRIKELSDASPFTFKELETANERLLRFNFSTERAAELIKIATDASAGMGAGAAGVDTITEAFGRMNSRTELTSRGIMALIAMGVPAFDMLAKGMGITTLQAEDLTKKGLIPSIDAIKILSEALETKYPEMASVIGGSFSSLKKTIADTMDFMFAELGKPVFDVLETSAKEWLAWLQSPSVKEAITEFATGLADTLRNIGDMFNALKGPVGDFANEVKSVAGGALQFVAEQLANAGQYWAGWSSQAGDAGKIVDASLTGTSGIVQALQFLVQGNFTAAWKTAAGAVGDFKSAVDPLRKILEDNRTLIIGIAAAFGTFAVLTTVVPPLLAMGSAIVEAVGAIGGLSIAVAEMGGPLAALALVVGGPVTLALGAVALAAGALTIAWANNWGDIQGKTATSVTAIGASLAEFGADMQTTGTKAATMRDDINAAFDPINTNIDNKVKRWGATLSAGWDQDKTDASTRLNALKDAINAVFDPINADIKTHTDDWTTTLRTAWDQDVIDARTNLGKLRDAINAGFDPINKVITDKVNEGLRALGKLWAIDQYSNATGAGGPGGVPNAYAGMAADLRPSQFSDPQLSGAEALAACGPAALVAFMKANGGKVPTLREAATIAGGPGIGWNTDTGMGGPANEQKLLSAYGLSSTLNLNPTTEQIQTGASNGAGEIISTLNHYFTASGFNADTGKYDVGTSGLDVKGGSASMRLDEMISLEGAINGLLTDIKSTSATTAGAVASSDVTSQKAGGLEAFKKSFAPYAEYAGKALNVDPSLVTAMAISESGGGNVPGNSFFGMKAGAPGSTGKTTQDTWEMVNGQRVNQKADFSTFDTPKASVDAWIEFIKKNDPAAVNASTPEQFAAGLKKGGYMTDSADAYAASLRGLGATGSGGATTYPGQQYGPAPASEADVYTLNAAQLEELAKKDAIKKAASGEAGFTELGKLSSTTADALEASQRAEQKKLAGMDTAAGKATTKIDTDLADKLGADLSGQTSGDMFSKRAIDEDIKARKEAQAEKIQDQVVANQIAVAADALRSKRAAEDDQLRTARAREDDNILHNQQLAHEALLHTRTLQDTEIQYQQAIQLEATAHARALEDEKILDNEKLAAQANVHQRALQDAQALANEQLALDQTVHQRKLQDQSLADGEALAGAATVHSRQLQDTEAAYQLNRSIGKNPANEAALRTAAADAADQLAHQRGLQDAEAKYQDNLRDIALAKSRQDADKEQAYKDQLADTALQTGRSNADKEALYQHELRATALLSSRADADKEAVYKEGLAKTALEHSRGLQDVEVQYQMGLAHTALMRKRDEEDVVRAETRAKEDGLIAHQIELAAAARAFARRQKDEQEAFDKILADEAYARTVLQLKAEAEIQKKNITDKLVLDKQAAIESAQADRDIKKAAFDEQAAGIIAKSKALVETAGGDFAPIEAKMLATVKAMDDAFATSHANSSAALVDLAMQAVSALGANGKVPTAVQETANALTTLLGEGSQATQAIEVSDRAVELFGQQFGLTWEQARPLLGQIEQGIYANLGENGLIPKHIAASDSAVEKFAHQWGISWDEARPILETESTRIKTTFGTDVPDAMGKSGMAAIKLNTDIQAIKDKTVYVTTEYKNSGKSTADLSGSNSGYAAAGQNFAVSSISDPSRSSGGDFSTYEGRQAYRDAHPGAVVDASGAYTPPGRAAGGPVLAGKAYMVGELGPELFTPGASSGSITPNAGAIDYERLARALAAEMQNVNLSVGVDDVHSSLLRKSRRVGALGLA